MDSGALLDPYYSYEPLVTLQRPLALCGAVGAPVAPVASMVSQLTGLPYVELDRWLEHEAGQTVSALALEEGERGLRRRERKLVRRALEQRPCPVIALGEGALLSRWVRGAVRRRADLVYLAAAPRDLWDGVRALSPGARYPFIRAPRDVGDLERYLASRVPTYAAAHRVLDAGRGSVIDLAREVIAGVAH